MLFANLTIFTIEWRMKGFWIHRMIFVIDVDSWFEENVEMYICLSRFQKLLSAAFKPRTSLSSITNTYDNTVWLEKNFENEVMDKEKTCRQVS